MAGGDEERQEAAGDAQVKTKPPEPVDLQRRPTLQRPVGRGFQGKTQALLVVLPRFSLDSEVNLKPTLVGMGLGDMFNLATADFTRITSKSFCSRDECSVNERS